jgi:hypothetical protein
MGVLSSQDRVFVSDRPAKGLDEQAGSLLRKAESSGEHTRFVPPQAVVRVKHVVGNLAAVDDRHFRFGNCRHPASAERAFIMASAAHRNPEGVPLRPPGVMDSPTPPLAKAK